MPCVGEVEGEHGGCELGRPQGALDEPRIDPGFEQMGGIAVAACFDIMLHLIDTH